MRVLHVEDNPVDADLARRIIARRAPDIELTNVSSYAAAKAALDQGYDLALIDLTLPDGNGLELLAEIRERQIPIATVMLTGSGDQRAAVASLQAGADDYVTKSVDNLHALPATLRNALLRNREAAARKSRPIRVLYAEPNAMDADLTRRHLARRAPHIRLTVVRAAADVLDRLPLSPDLRADFDVVLLDYRLPGLDALETVKMLRVVRGLTIPIVMVTGQGSETIAAQAMHLGVDDYISKHDEYLHELPSTLEKVHREGELVRERAQLEETTSRLNRLLAASPVILYTLRLEGGQAVVSWVSENVAAILGYTTEQALCPGWWSRNLHPDDRDAVHSHLAALSATGHLKQTYRFLDSAGAVHWLDDELLLPQTGGNHTAEAIGVWRDVTATKQAEQVQLIRMAVLDRLVANAPLPEILKEVAVGLENIRPDMRVSILLMDPLTGLLNRAAGPSLPDFYREAVSGFNPGANVGSCGLAAALGEPVIVEDIRIHPCWAAFAPLAERAGLRANWSIPFKDEGGRVLGTFGIYYSDVRSPTQADLDLVDEFARLTSLAVRRANSDTALRQAAAVFASTREGVIVTDLTPSILAVNGAYLEITGFAESEVVGRNPRLFKSGRHDSAFYQAMWSAIQSTGHWQGEVWNRRKNGELFPQLLTVSTVYDDKGAPSHYVGAMTDISQLKRSQEQLEHLAHFDPLTDLPNRPLVQSRLQYALEQAERLGHRVAVLFIDLDRFKNVNDSLGHPAGDQLLTILAQRMREKVPSLDTTLGRWGGDEFLLVLEKVEQAEEAANAALGIIQLLEQPFALPHASEVYVGASIGISLYPSDGRGVTELIQHADVAMYQAKEQGRNTYRFYTPALSEAANDKLNLEVRLRRALANGEFVLHYQPQIDISTGALIGCEALVRWQDPVEGLISPLRFIPVAEETGLIAALGEWVLLSACTQAQAWRAAGLSPLTLSVNLSVRQLSGQGLVDNIAEVLAKTGLPPAWLKLELTESMIMEQGESAIELLHGFKALGVSLSIDDFGTGYSSLAYLKRFPIDELKIDRGFVRDIPADKNDMEIAATIIAMGRSLNMKVLAEGVETQEQLDFLAHRGCHAYQGYLCSRPIPAGEFTRFLAAAGRYCRATPAPAASGHDPGRQGLPAADG
ncbi:EAL domain-containing protein [Methylococcus sp. EFPC2]|uniref:EAL domain-containing protein n=1 Tax=Methylococcus sp. EFPC2 TaxID=2812648 RepID=UPI0019682AD6|nr:EAL domain-containing protein [Methylococcus sp. EFPC2]QSA97541.1 EAL domain-containing protein [Methylococcus sp. EFPC2]